MANFNMPNKSIDLPVHQNIIISFLLLLAFLGIDPAIVFAQDIDGCEPGTLPIELSQIESYLAQFGALQMYQAPNGDYCVSVGTTSNIIGNLSLNTVHEMATDYPEQFMAICAARGIYFNPTEGEDSVRQTCQQIVDAFQTLAPKQQVEQTEIQTFAIESYSSENPLTVTIPNVGETVYLDITRGNDVYRVIINDYGIFIGGTPDEQYSILLNDRDSDITQGMPFQFFISGSGDSGDQVSFSPLP